MKAILAATAAMGLAIAAVPAAAQMEDDMAGENMGMVKMNAQQQAMYDGWRQSRKDAYDTWDDKSKTYFWTLGPAEMEGWWALTDAQKTQIMALTPEQQTRAWASIKSQIASASTSTTASTSSTGMSSGSTTTATTSASASPRFVSNEMVQTMSTASKPANGEYPVCSSKVTDNCVNPYAVGKGGNKPLDSWPGKPASEM